MSDWVLDCSTALAAALPDEGSQASLAFLARLGPNDRLWIPALFWTELGNGLEVARRRGRVTEAIVNECISIVGQLPLMTDWLLGPEATWRQCHLAAVHGLSAYDAAYLELALRRGLGLASLDERLSAAACGAGLAVLG